LSGVGNDLQSHLVVVFGGLEHERSKAGEFDRTHLVHGSHDLIERNSPSARSTRRDLLDAELRREQVGEQGRRATAIERPRSRQDGPMSDPES